MYQYLKKKFAFRFYTYQVIGLSLGKIQVNIVATFKLLCGT